MTAAGIAAAGAGVTVSSGRCVGWRVGGPCRPFWPPAADDGQRRRTAVVGAAVGVAALKVRRKGGGDAALRRECGGRRSTGESAEGAGVVGTVPEGQGSPSS
jgi:hypothetical protein